VWIADDITLQLLCGGCHLSLGVERCARMIQVGAIWLSISILISYKYQSLISPHQTQQQQQQTTRRLLLPASLENSLSMSVCSAALNSAVYSLITAHLQTTLALFIPAT